MLRKFIAITFLVIIAASCVQDEATDYAPIDKKIIEDYLAEKQITGVQTTASGLYYLILNPGTVNHPNSKSRVWVNYKGTLIDGTIFDSSYKYGKPSEIPLSSVVAGWREGMQLIGVGGKIQLFIPSILGYGSAGNNTIPANAVIIFDIELVDFY